MQNSPDGWVTVLSPTGDAWLMPALGGASVNEDNVAAAEIPAEPVDAEPDWLTRAAADVRQREEGETEAHGFSSTPPVRRMAKALHHVAERSMHRMQSRTSFMSVLMFMLLASLFSVSVRYTSLSVRSAEVSEQAATYSFFANQARRVILLELKKELKGTETALAHAHDELTRAAAERRELEEEFRAAGAERKALQIEKQSLEDALARSDAALTEARDELNEARANAEALSMSAEEARKKLSTIKGSSSVHTCTHQPAATVGSEERHELLRDARSLVAEGEKARKHEREAWQRRLSEHQQQTEALGAALRQARQEAAATQTAREKERAAWHRQMRAATKQKNHKPPRDEKLQGEKPKQKLPDELRAESTQRPDHEGIQGGRRRGRNHRHSGNRDRSHSHGGPTAHSISASTPSWLSDIYSRYGAVDDWQSSLAAWQSALGGSVGAKDWPFSSCAARARGGAA